MIFDGYTEHVEFNGDDLLFRPFTRHDRVAIANTLQSIPERVGERVERMLVESRIVYETWGVGVDALDDREFQELRRITFGIGRTQQELADEENLLAGARLLAQYPHFGRFTCDQCRVWHFDPVSFTPIRQNWSDELRKKRPGEPVLCEVDTCPRGHWENPVSFSEKNGMAYRHYQTFREALPDDPIVNRNARIIRQAAELSGADTAVAGRR